MMNQIGVIRSVCNHSKTVLVAWLEIHGDGNIDILRVREYPFKEIEQVPSLSNRRLGYAVRNNGYWNPPMDKAPTKKSFECGQLVKLVVCQ